MFHVSKRAWNFQRFDLIKKFAVFIWPIDYDDIGGRLSQLYLGRLSQLYLEGEGVFVEDLDKYSVFG